VSTVAKLPQVPARRFGEVATTGERVAILEFGKSDNLAYHLVPIRPINWLLSSIGRPPDALPSCLVLRSWVAKW
jgi:hypothetical protein